MDFPETGPFCTEFNVLVSLISFFALSLLSLESWDRSIFLGAANSLALSNIFAAITVGVAGCLSSIVSSIWKAINAYTQIIIYLSIFQGYLST